ncbi:enolase-phosphatase E1-like [Anneissia japonica]|uniref:enolase-phosphatase E1-like n=1 Tax=Anneissia japonica TaxID=1529436 RepID=UPI001425B2A4|nr:enolase-phosphatase E1-like [Anneissia japonica]
MALSRKRDSTNCIKCILLDIEGTTTPISFVKDILFGYVRSNLKEYLEKHWEEDQCQLDVQSLREQSKKDLEEHKSQKESNKDKPKEDSKDEKSQNDSIEDKLPPVIPKKGGSSALIRQAVVEYVFTMMDADRKVTSLKQLQGHMWSNAYSCGEVVGEIYKDVLPAIIHWKSEGKKIYIYSSGSVEAQKLLFGHTKEGDILEYISGHFDTKIGAKVEKDSYCTIAKEIQCETKEILFLTDVTREARPAKQAGCQVAIVTRPGNATLSSDELEEFQHVSSFSELYSDAAVEVKKRKMSSVDDEGEKPS